MHHTTLGVCLFLATSHLAGCHPDSEPPASGTSPDASVSSDAPTSDSSSWIADPGLVGPPFQLNDATCVDSGSQIKCVDVVYSQVGGVSLHLDLYAPPAARTQRVPAIMYLHGGGWSLGSYHNPGLAIERYVAAGYAVVSVEYRLTLKGGTPTGYVFPADIQDVKTAVRWLRTKGSGLIDGDRILGYGFSAGAHLAMLLADTANVGAFEGRGDPAVPSTVKGIVALSPAIDFHLFIPQNPPLDASCPPQDPVNQTPIEAISLLIGADCTDPQNADALTALSPLTYLDASSAAMLVFSGTCDQTVPYRGAVDFAEQASALGIDQIDVEIVEGAFHGGTLGTADSKAALESFIANQLGT